MPEGKKLKAGVIDQIAQGFASINLEDVRKLDAVPAGDKVTVLRVLRGLESRGLVQRSPAPASRRNLAVALSDEGAALLDKAQKPAEKAYRRLLAPLSAQQQVTLVDLLQQLTDGLEHEARAPFVRPEHD